MLPFLHSTTACHFLLPSVGTFVWLHDAAYVALTTPQVGKCTLWLGTSCSCLDKEPLQDACLAAVLEAAELVSCLTGSWLCIGSRQVRQRYVHVQGLEPDILSVAMMLCQDPTAAVRSAVAKQMGHVVCKLWIYGQAQQHTDTGQSGNAKDHGRSSLQEQKHIHTAQTEQASDFSTLNPQMYQHADTGKTDSEDNQGQSDELANEMSILSINEDGVNIMQQEIVHSLRSLASQDAYQLRQQYVEVCHHIAIACKLSAGKQNVFQQYFMQPMLELAQDKVDNVRLAVARALNNLTELAQLPEVIGVLDMLERDTDPDVASYITTTAIKP